MIAKCPKYTGDKIVIIKNGTKYNVTVLQGVTGSGKTLVYFERIKNLVGPDFYKPFKRKNIDIMYGYITKSVYKNKIRIVKGDGDQDRPS